MSRPTLICQLIYRGLSGIALTSALLRQREGKKEHLEWKPLEKLLKQKVVVEGRRGVDSTIVESFVAMMGRIQDQLEVWLDTPVADFHFKPIEIYHNGGDQTKVVIIINTKPRRVVFMLWWCGCS